MRRSATLVVLAYLTIYVVWGSTYFFIRQSVATIPPFAVLAMRWTVGGVLLLLAGGIGGRLRRMPSWREIGSAVLLGSLLLLIGNGLITMAEQRVNSYIAALLACSSPILVALFDRLLLGRRLGITRIAGVALGFAGVVLLLYDGHSVATSLSPHVLLGMAGAVSWSLATSLGHRFPVHGDNLVNSGIQMLFTGLASLAIMLLAGHRPAAVAAAMSGASFAGVAYLAIVGSIAFSAYTYLVSVEPAERVVSYALVNPVIALFLGLAVGSEAPTPLLAVGMPLIIAGLAFMLYGERLTRWRAAWRVERRRETRKGALMPAGSRGRWPLRSTVGLVPALAPALAVVALVAVPFPALRRALNDPAGSRLLDARGELIASLPGPGGSLMERLPSAAIPAACREIFVRLEDRRFFAHPGVDPLALARAIGGRLAGSSSSGASTISMQLARLLVPRRATAAGKIVEMIRALRLEARLPKEEILTLWLNLLPFGRNAVGVGAAARRYFAASLEQLSAAQLVLLAVIPRNPSRFDPFDDRETLRAEAVRASARAGLGIGADELDAALRSAHLGGAVHQAPHFERYVAAFVVGGTGDIPTTLDLELNRFLHARIGAYLEASRSARVTNAAAIAIENASGRVLAWVGSRDFDDEGAAGQIDGVLIRRQSASTLKPFLYALALGEGWTAASLLADAELSFAGTGERLAASGSPDAGVYRPVNFDRRSRGVVRLRSALASSLNVPAVYLLSRLGLPRFLDHLRSLGFSIPEEATERWGLGAAIGNAEITLLELARAFSVFPRGGELIDLAVLERPAIAARAPRRVYDPRVAWLVADILADPASRSTGFGTSTWFDLPVPAMFKSGTSSEFTDLWCVGATPRYTVAAWAGNFDGRAVINRTGSSLPARIVADVLARLAAGAEAFERPDGLLVATICTVSGGRATPSCPSTRAECFLSGVAGLPEPCRFHPGGSRRELLLESLLGTGGRPRIAVPVDGQTFWLDRTSPGERVPVVVAAREGEELSLMLDGVEVRRWSGPLSLGLHVDPGEHRLELVGQRSRTTTRFSAR